MTNLDDDVDAAYRQSAEVVYRELKEYAEFARKLQSEYGKWLITTLYLVHAGAIAGLLFKHSAVAALPYLAALWLFVAGLVFCADGGILRVAKSKLARSVAVENGRSPDAAVEEVLARQSSLCRHDNRVPMGRRDPRRLIHDLYPDRGRGRVVPLEITLAFVRI